MPSRNPWINGGRFATKEFYADDITIKKSGELLEVFKNGDYVGRTNTTAIIDEVLDLNECMRDKFSCVMWQIGDNLADCIELSKPTANKVLQILRKLRKR